MSIIRQLSNWFLFRKYKTGIPHAMPESYDKKFSICIRLTDHPAAEVRRQAVGEITHPDHSLDREKEVVSVLANRIMNDKSLDVRRYAVSNLIQQLGYSSMTRLGLNTYPDALKALSTWLSTAPLGQELYLCALNNLPDRFFWVVTNTENSDAFIDAISMIACDDKREPSDRNWATIILAKLQDKRCRDVLEGLSYDPDPYVSGNAKKGLEQLKTA